MAVIKYHKDRLYLHLVLQELQGSGRDLVGPLAVVAGAGAAGGMGRTTEAVTVDSNLPLPPP